MVRSNIGQLSATGGVAGFVVKKLRLRDLFTVLFVVNKSGKEYVLFLGLALRLPSGLRQKQKGKLSFLSGLSSKQGVLLNNKLSFLSVLSLEMCNLLLCKYNQFTCK